MSSERPPHPSSRSWLKKFRDAMRGIKIAVRGEASFFVHFFVTAVVVLAAGVFQCTTGQWAILLLCVALVMTAETFNTALERLAKAVSGQSHPELRDALDIASGAVLLASIGAALVGAMVFGSRLLEMFSQ